MPHSLWPHRIKASRGPACNLPGGGNVTHYMKPMEATPDFTVTQAQKQGRKSGLKQSRKMEKWVHFLWQAMLMKISP